MPTKLHGPLNLGKIPKELITTDKFGEKTIWIDVVERLTPGRSGQTHSICIYDKANRRNVYIADLTPQEFGKSVKPAPQSTPKTAPAPTADDQDLPF